MNSAYIRVTDPRRNDRQLGRDGLNALRLYSADTATRLGSPVARIRAVNAEDFIVMYWRTVRAIEAQGFDWHADLTKQAERSLGIDECSGRAGHGSSGPASR